MNGLIYLIGLIVVIMAIYFRFLACTSVSWPALAINSGAQYDDIRHPDGRGCWY